MVFGIDEETQLAVSLTSLKSFIPLEVLYEIKNVVDFSIEYWENSSDNIEDINNSLFADFYNRQKTSGFKIGKKANIDSHLYLMTDTTNGFHKIGISKDPKYRESTLQSEKPSVILVWSSPIKIEKVNKLEQLLHNKFDSKRIRGEWFNLSESDIDFIKNNFQDLLISK